MNSEILNLKVEGLLDVEDAVEFMDSDTIKVMFRDIEIPKINKDSILVDYEYTLLKSLEWLKKAKQEADGFNKFFSLWVGYNAFYNHYHFYTSTRRSQGSSEKNKIIQTAKLLTISEKRAILFKHLTNIEYILKENYTIKLRGKDGDVKQKLKEYIEKFRNDPNDDNIEIAFEFLLKLLYGIRNNLFHGKKLLSDYIQEKLLTKAYNILLTIFSLMLIKYLICYHSHNAPYELCPFRTQR
ncbi:hypothetical protein [Thermococcus sp. 9N3]|uniref:hypothetical protein n=1 Tax=Thermococcus sp. 9N3 TaxID=163002 RepID=UPI001430D36D|nr:hypothetical protein [Thermococcus sp. 9N3]NJE49616.1 hypothetical protein [Thermococcus sp. 9N3]